MSDEKDKLDDYQSSGDFIAMQNRINSYKKKLEDLDKKEYQGRSQGVNIKMLGNYSIIETTIDQSFYEVASKNQIERAYLICFTNLKNAIDNEKNQITKDLQEEIERFRVEALKKQTDGKN